MTPKQRLFVAEYLATMCATEAARRAGYRGNDATLGQVGYENLRKPELAAEIEAGLRNRLMGPNEVLTRLADQARGTMSDFVRLDEKGTPTLDLKQASDRGKLHLVKKLFWSETGPRIELYSSKDALELLGKGHGLFKEGGGPKGTLDDPLHTVQMTPAEWKAETEKRRSQAEATLAEFDTEAGEAEGSADA